jgi:Uma2 family endonuclease
MTAPVADKSQLTLKPIPGRPAWEIAYLYPAQGSWSEADYFALESNHMIEFSDGWIEVLPMPTALHQLIAQFLFTALNVHVTAHALGQAYMAPLPVRLSAGKIREPDVLFLRPGRLKNVRGYPDGVDLAMEVVSDDPEGRKRDFETKREEYANAGIPEYWIVDPEKRRVIVLTLAGSSYRVFGDFRLGSVATSVLLPGFTVNIDDLFAPAVRIEE